MDVAILSGDTGWHASELCRALEARGHTACLLPYEGLVARLGHRGAGSALTSRGRGVLEFDAVLARFVPSGSLEQIIYRVDALHWIEHRGVPVINSARAIERSVDKFFTTALLQDHGLPTPETVVCEDRVEAVAAVRAMGDAIVKPLFGSMGAGMIRVTADTVTESQLGALEQMKSVFYVQRAIDHGGRDLRVFVLGGRVLGAIERGAPPGEWRTNLTRAGSAVPCALPPEWANLAIRAASVVGADYAGVDLLPSSDGRVFVIEVNGIPGWRGLQEATGIDVAGAVVDYLPSRLARTDSRPVADAFPSPAGA